MGDVEKESYAEKYSPRVILVKKVSYEEYQQLLKENTLPLVVEATKDQEMGINYFNIKGNLYTLDLDDLARHTFFVGTTGRQNILTFDGKTKYPVVRVVGKFNSRENEDGLVVEMPVTKKFYSLKNLLKNVLKDEDKKEDIKRITNKEPEKVTITSQIVNSSDYSIIRENHFLPFLVVLTPFEYRVIAKPFDKMYSKLSTTPDGKVTMVIDPFYIKNLVDASEIELNGIELLNNEVHNIDEIVGNVDNDLLGGFYVDDSYLSVTAYASSIIGTNKEKNPIKALKY